MKRANIYRIAQNLYGDVEDIILCYDKLNQWDDDIELQLKRDYVRPIQKAKLSLLNPSLTEDEIRKIDWFLDDIAVDLWDYYSELIHELRMKGDE